MLRAGIVVVIPLLFVSVFFSATAAVADDRGVLIRFKSSVSDPAGLLSSWTGADHCSWTGVTCSSDALARVVAVNISGKLAAGNLGGNLTPSLFSLSELAVLSLPFHSFTGVIPVEIGQLVKLRTLEFQGNQFSGSIPSTISSCTNLETVDFSGNKLNSSIPPSLFALPSLKSLRLASNHLSGSIPSEIGEKCSNLEKLDLSRNLLVGSIPAGLGNCSKLQSLVLFSNLFDDWIPPELGRLSMLRVLDVSRNSLSGSVPPDLGRCMELSVLVLSNPFNPIQVQDDLSYGDSDDFNYFHGSLSERITSLPKLRVLWAPMANLEGELPRNWGKNLEAVNLGQNLFSGEFPKELGQCKNLKYLNLSSNKLVGWIEEDLSVPCMDVFDVSRNQLSGAIPRFVTGSCLSLHYPLDDVLSPYSSLFIRKMQAAILLPYADPGVSITVYHNFGFNNFSGSLLSFPIAMEKLGNKTVYVFLVNGNTFVGRMNDGFFEKCRWLKGLVMDVSDNLISGPIPSGISEMCRGLIVLAAANNRIAGIIPKSFGLLGNLTGLDLSRNWLQGQIPASFGMMKGLEYLLLAENNLTGSIPTNLTQLLSIRVLDLSSNSLSGEIPSRFADLKNLSTLLVDNNKLWGKIPNVTSLSMFNASFNNLTGPLPSNSSMMKCDSFIGNPLLPCPRFPFPSVGLQGSRGDSQSYPYPPPVSPPSKGNSSGFNSIEIASITSAAAIVSVLLALIILYLYTRKCVPRSSVQSSGSREVKIFHEIGVPVTYESVVRATGNFNASNCIGSGGFGATYKAEISPGVLVAIKRLSVGRFQGVQQFHAEIKTLGRWRHPNLVTLIGYHVSESEMFLIYNYLPGGNLERFIQDRSKRPTDWKMLHKIALDVARALAYLHDHCVPRILHRDVKPSNILLDNDLNAYLSDFGLARLLGNSETHATTGVAGTFGYVAPEYAMTCRVSDKADVYSYGVVLLELVSDKKALDPSFSPYGNGFNIVAWACMLLRQGRAREFFTEGLWDVGPHDDLVETLHLAVMCTVETLSIRPTMKQVVQRLKQLQPPTC